MVDNMTSRNYRRINADLYKALSEGDDAKVCDACRDLPDGPLHKLTIHRDTILHIAGYYKRNKLVLQLLSLLPEDEPNKLTLKNEAGNTILHATATNDKTVEAAAEILHRAPSLLTMTDRLGETPFFRAARYGKIKSFYFLKGEVNRRFPEEADLTGFLRRNDKATILHVAIHSENFDLAHDIAEAYPMLIGEQDGDGMTGLQLLACKPSAFNHGFEENFFKRFISKFIDLSAKERTSRVPILKEVQKQNRKTESANKLATILIEKDASWEATSPMSNQNRIKPHKYGGGISSSTITSVDIVINAPTHDSPLFLATKSGCTEIVKEILQVYPQAVEHIDEDGRDILHVAIKYRRMEIYKAVINMKFPLTRLRGKIDKQGNSILHMVGMKVSDQKTEGDIRSPAVVLRDDLLLFESVKNICTTLATLQVNNKGETAEQLFIENNAQLRIDAKEWMKSTAEHCSIVAVLIATVAFAAAYTVPGGPNQSTGYPLLKSKPFFIVFALADALSLTFSLTSVIIFLSILTSSFRLKDFKNSLHNKLLLGLTVLILSVSMMMISFAATLILTISSGQDWTNIMLYMISFFPVTVFVCSYVHLYKLLIKAFEERVKMIIASILPTPDVESINHPIHPSQPPTANSFV
ncbi:ankyrin repeat-containing protein At5g02620 [Lactuca sativa]|uniref:PGG domain-containing protein n=1 Tax=Lactuca sativa TaxID=4236 RepID=A0A9R1X1N5_LACSA|nr:ankyrin repeat-containing protein At5g02620 [Lactuca sativa]KAJ0195831.1 hypothetical protein LSAT_V11C700348110 [Lactuca sativa]